MDTLGERQLIGLEHLDAATTLLQTIRATHPTAGLWEAADRQWSWRNERTTDALPQLFWFDEAGRPKAAVIITDSPHGVSFDPIVMPDATPDWVAHVVDRGLAHAATLGFEDVETDVDRDGQVIPAVLFDRGFTVVEASVTEAWLRAERLPEISSLADVYRLTSRAESAHPVHHMTSEERGHPDPEQRLRQTSLYRPDLDLVVHDANDQVAAYGLFWFDPVTATALVEPMRTEEAHQQRGLARHVLTAGLSRLVDAGAERIKIVYEEDNAATKHLYLSVGFEPDRHTDLLAGRTGPSSAER